MEFKLIAGIVLLAMVTGVIMIIIVLIKTKPEKSRDKKKESETIENADLFLRFPMHF